MTRQERNQLDVFPMELANTVNNLFGADVECRTEMDFLGDGKYKTFFKAEGERATQIQMFIDGYIAGNRELSTRMHDKSKWR